MKSLLATALILAAFPAAAQDIRYKMDEIAKGSTVTVNDRRGQLVTYEMKGKIGQHYYYQSYKGPDITGARDTIIATDIDGNITRVSYKDGRFITFSPHSCYRVLGDCEYVEKRSDRAPRTYLRTTRLDGTQLVFSLTLKDTGREVVTGRAWLDRFGWPIDAVYTRPNGQTVRESVIARDYK